MTTVRDATIALLRQCGMTTVFGNPGSTELPMFRDFPEDFRYILGLQESVVVGMADGFAQATGTAALVNLHSAAGVGHALGNLFTAHKNQTPLVVTAGQQARGILPFEPFLFAERAAEFPRPYVKWAIEPARAEDVPGAILRAWLVAMTPPRGVAFVSVPVDDWDRRCEPVEFRTLTGTNPGDPARLAAVGQMLAEARSPALVVGAGVARDGAWDAVVALAERHRAPVWVSPLSARASYPEDHPLFAGFLTAGRGEIVQALDGHDLVLALGGPLSHYHYESQGPHVPDGVHIVLIGDNPVHGEWAPVGEAIVANTRAAVTTLLAGPAPSDRIPPVTRTLPGAPDPQALTGALLMARIAALRPADAVVVEESPSTRAAMHDHLPILHAQGFHTTASGGLGHGMPAAVGIALARPGVRVIALIGDGSSMYAIQALWSAAQLGANVSFVIVNNARYEALHSFGRMFGLQELVGTKLPGLDFVGLAAAQGVSGRLVASVGELDAALAWSFAMSGPTLVDVRVD
jgi:benzoylformate decarboxylase